MLLEGGAVGRIRSKKNRNLEMYVRVNTSGYVTYKHPRMEHYESFGKDVAAANEMAAIVNARLSGETDRISRVLSLHKRSGPRELPLFSDVIERFIKERPAALKWSKSTLDQHMFKLVSMKAYGGDTVYEDTDVLFFSEMVEALFSGTTRRPAISLCRQIDAFAVGRGLRIGPNVGDRILKPPRVPRQRQRIKTYADFLKIREHAPRWIQDAMDFALITLQPRQVLCTMNLGMISDNKLRVKRIKTGAYIEIEIGESLKSLIARRKVEAVRFGTRRLLCKPPYQGSAVEIKPPRLTNAFTKAVKDSGLYESNLPTFHEIRSLGGRMYEERGFDKKLIQNLMGHKEQSTTDIYLDPDEPKYIKSKAILELE